LTKKSSLKNLMCHVWGVLNQYRQFILFILVGILNTVFGYAVFAILIFAGLHYTLAVLLSTCLGVLFNFKTIGKIVFKNSDIRLIFKFIGVYVIQYFCNIGLIKIFLLFLNIYLAGAFSTLFCAIISYTLNKYFVFNRLCFSQKTRID